MKKSLTLTSRSNSLLTFDLKMKLSMLLLFLVGFAAKANNAYGQETKITLSLDKVTVEQFIDEIESTTDLRFIYKTEDVDLNRLISLRAKKDEITNILNIVFGISKTDFKIIEGQIYLVKRQTSPKIKDKKIDKAILQQTISGVITDENGTPLPGASIIVKGTTNSTTTDFDGNFTIQMDDINGVLVVSYIGFSTLEVPINGRQQLSIVLREYAAGLDEVVVVGYGSQQKKDLTGSVSSVKEDAFNQGVITSPEQLFQGKLSGVRIVNSSGEPGAGIDVFIRGAGSIRSGNLPLFVVDGVPLSNDPTSAAGTNVGFGSSRARNPLNFLNPSDIESVDVLKDASAAAIYGARGSNGVVLITTKKAKSEVGSLSYDTYYGFSTVANQIDVLSSDQFASNSPDAVFDISNDTDWQNEIFRTAAVQYHNLTYGRANGKNNYNISLNYFDQEGVVEKSELERISGRVNTSNTFFDDDRLVILTNLAVSKTRNEGIPTSDSSGSGGELITNALRANPTFPVREDNGEFFAFTSASNPVALLDIFSDRTITTRILGNIDAKLRIFDGFHYKINLGFDTSTAERNTTVAQTNLFDVIANPNGFFAQSNNDNSSVLVENLLSYGFNANELNGTFLLGHAYQKFNVSGTLFSVADFSTSEIDPANNPNIGTTVNQPTGFSQENELQSFFGRLNLDWKNRYLFTASMRADGSTRFGDNSKYGYFPSFATGWKISNEPFWNSNFINNLKLRTSWGVTGNQEVPNKVTQASLTSSSANGAFLGIGDEITNGVTLARTANPNLKWEVVEQTNIGLDFALGNGRFYGTFDWFNKTTSDVILLIPTSAPAPTSTIWANIDGEIVNTGFEFLLGGSLVNSETFKWNADINGTFLKNEVRNLSLSQIITGSLSGPGLSGAGINIITNGESLGSFLLFEHQGFDENGLNIIADTNGDGIITNEDRIIAGDALPDFLLGFNSNFSYRNWDLSFNLIGEFGAELYNNTANAFFNVPQFLNGNNVPIDVVNSGESQANSPAVSTLYLEDANFIRLNNLTLGYTINTANMEWISNFRIYGTTQNLFTITDYSGYDPSNNTDKAIGGNTSFGIDFASYPSARTFLFGLNVTF